MVEFIARRGLDQGKPDPSLFNILGIVEMKRSRSHYARDYFKKSLEISPTYAPAMINRALIAMSDMDLSLAEEDLKAALQIAPQNIDGLLNMGILMRQTGRFQDARRHLERASGLEPENSLVRYHLGVLYAENLKRSDEAIRLMSEVVQLEQNNKKLRSDAQNYLSILRERRKLVEKTMYTNALNRSYDRESCILIVDDDPSLLKFFKIHLNKFFLQSCRG